ncbi:MAG: hypothetical protein KDD50_08905 [Bdellovibrionales bacterium]|nr:hypothetical protein [Bdellovibrionales bacterium]
MKDLNKFTPLVLSLCVAMSFMATPYRAEAGWKIKLPRVPKIPTLKKVAKDFGKLGKEIGKGAKKAAEKTKQNIKEIKKDTDSLADGVYKNMVRKPIQKTASNIDEALNPGKKDKEKAEHQKELAKSKNEAVKNEKKARDEERAKHLLTLKSSEEKSLKLLEALSTQRVLLIEVQLKIEELIKAAGKVDGINKEAREFTVAEQELLENLKSIYELKLEVGSDEKDQLNAKINYIDQVVGLSEELKTRQGEITSLLKSFTMSELFELNEILQMQIATLIDSTIVEGNELFEVQCQINILEGKNVFSSCDDLSKNKSGKQ